jgi:hypothetical protein
MRDPLVNEPRAAGEAQAKAPSAFGILSAAKGKGSAKQPSVPHLLRRRVKASMMRRFNAEVLDSAPGPPPAFRSSLARASRPLALRPTRCRPHWEENPCAPHAEGRCLRSRAYAYL